MASILAIDPGNTDSGWCVIDADSRRPTSFAKSPNEELLERLYSIDEDGISADVAVIEMVSSYGNVAGSTLFETCVWIGRFYEAITGQQAKEPTLVLRPDVKAHHTGQRGAKDRDIIAALRDRFAYGVGNYGKGSKDAPGFFYGFKADVWQAYALAVYEADRIAG